MSKPSEKFLELSGDSIAALGYHVISLVGNQMRNAINGKTKPSTVNGVKIEDASQSNNAKIPETQYFRRRSSLTQRRLSLSNNNANVILPVYTMEEVSMHDCMTDCWVVIYDRVYDVTSFLYEHPGGLDVLLEYAGRDATIPFRSAGHTKDATVWLQQYLVGVISEEENIWKSIF